MAEPELTPEQIKLLTPLLNRIRDRIRKEAEQDSEFAILAYKRAYTTHAELQGKTPAEIEFELEEELAAARDVASEYKRAKVDICDVYQLVSDGLREYARIHSSATGQQPTQSTLTALALYFADSIFMPEGAYTVPFELTHQWGTEIIERADIVSSDLENEVIRWPDAFSWDQKIGIIGTQLEQVELISPGERTGGIWAENLEIHRDAFDLAVQSVSTETEHSFPNIVDRLLAYAMGPERTDDQRARKAEFGVWEFLNSPQMVSPDQWADEYEARGLDEAYIEKYATNPGAELEKEIMIFWPDSKLVNPDGSTSKEGIAARTRIIDNAKIRFAQNIATQKQAGSIDATISLSNLDIIDEIYSSAGEEITAAMQAGVERKFQEETEKELKDRLGKITSPTQAKTAVGDWVRDKFGFDAEMTEEGKNRFGEILWDAYEHSRRTGAPLPTNAEILDSGRGIAGQLVDPLNFDPRAKESLWASGRDIAGQLVEQKRRQTSLEKFDTDTEANAAVTQFMSKYFGIGTEIPDYAKNAMAKGLLDSYTRAELTGGPVPDDQDVLGSYAPYINNWIERQKTDPEQVARGILGITDFSKMALDKEVTDRLEASVGMLSEGIKAGLESDPFSGQLAGDVGAGFMQNIGLTPMGGLAPLPGVTGMMAPLPRDTDPSLTSGGMDIYQPTLESFTQQPASFGDYPPAVRALAGFDPVEALRQQYDEGRPPTPTPGFFTAGEGLEPIGGRGVMPTRNYGEELAPALQMLFDEGTPEFQNFMAYQPEFGAPSLLARLIEEFRKSQQISREDTSGAMGAVAAQERAMAEREAKGLPTGPTRYGAASAAWGDLRRAELPTMEKFVEGRLPGIRTEYEASPFYGQEQTRLTREREYEESIAEREASIAESTRRGELRGGTSIFRRRTA